MKVRNREVQTDKRRSFAAKNKMIYKFQAWPPLVYIKTQDFKVE